MQSFILKLQAVRSVLSARTKVAYAKYRSLPTWQQWTIGVGIAAVVIGGIAFLQSDSTGDDVPRDRVVTLATVGSLSGNGSGGSLFGTVRSVTEAQLLAQTGGTVRRVNTTIGATVPAGFVVVELDNAAEAASVLQAEGAYDAAIAARNAQSLPDTQASARNTYRTAFTTLDTTVENNIDTFFGGPTPVGPKLLIYPSSDVSDRLSRERDRIEDRMRSFEANQATAAGRSPVALLDEAEAIARELQTFLNQLADAANETDARATSAQLAALASARADVNSVLSSITVSRTSLRSGSVSATAGADASVKQALGSLRAAQASFEKTRVRATIGGTINFLPVTQGQYVTSFMHVATVAQNGALEIVAYVSEEERDLLSPGMDVTIEGTTTGVITSVSPALDPITKQIEVRIAVAAGSTLVNGQSVRIALPGAPAEPVLLQEGPILLPLTAVKLQSKERIVFTVDGEGRLSAYPVEIGDVRGDRIQITSALPLDLRIVSDARGLSAGQRVRVGDAPQ